MRKFLVVLALVSAAVALAGTLTREVLVTTAGVTISRTAGTSSIELENLGADPIYCAPGSTVPSTSTGRRIDASGGTWALDYSGPVSCIEPTTNQTSGSGTRVTELP